MYRGLREVFIIALVATLYGVLVGTGLLILLISVASLTGGISLAEFFAVLGRSHGFGSREDAAIAVLERIVWLGYVLTCVGFALGAIRSRMRRRLLGG